MATFSQSACACLLCRMEIQLLADLNAREPNGRNKTLARSDCLKQFSCAAQLLAYLKSSAADTRTDEVFQELLAIGDIDRAFGDTLFVLAFVPMLHRIVRSTANNLPNLAADDIAQQALTTLLQFLYSEELRMRRSHFAFAISR